MKSRTPLIATGIYLALVVFSTVVLLAGSDALGGLLLVVLGLPWTLVLMQAVTAISPTFFDSGWSGVALGLAGAAINAAIVYAVAAWIVKRRARRSEA